MASLPEVIRERIGRTRLGELFMLAWVTIDRRTFAPDFLTKHHVQIHDLSSTHNHPAFLPLPQDLAALRHHLNALRNTCHDQKSKYLRPPSSGGPRSNSHPYSSLEWCGIFEMTMYMLSRHWDGKDDKQGYAVPQEPDWDIPFDRVIIQGQQTNEVPIEEEKNWLQRTLWRGMKILQEGNFLGCLLADKSCGGFIGDCEILRSEFICIAALTCKQVLDQKDCGNSNLFDLELETIVITFTHLNVRVLQSYFTWLDGTLQLHIVTRLNEKICEVAGEDEKAEQLWATVVSWMRFCGNVSGQEDKFEDLHVPKKSESKKDGSMGLDADRLPSEAISERLFSGPMDKPKMSSPLSSSSDDSTPHAVTATGYTLLCELLG